MTDFRSRMILACVLVGIAGGCGDDSGAVDSGMQRDARVQDTSVDARSDVFVRDASGDADRSDAGPDATTPPPDRCAACDNLDVEGRYALPAVQGDANAYVPTSASELSNPSRAGSIAILSASFDVSGTTFAADQVLVPAGGALTGTGVDLNGATLINNGLQAFDSSLRFASVYTRGCLGPEMFGAGEGEDDADAIEAMVDNGELATSPDGATYRFDTPKVFDRGGVFKWSAGGAVIESSVDMPGGEYLMTWEGTRHELCDLEIDGNDVTERLMRVERSDFYLDGVEFHHFRTEQTDERAITYQINVYTDEGADFRIYDSSLHDVLARGSSTNPLVVTGVTRQLWFIYRETRSPAMVHIRDSEFANTRGNNGDAIQLAVGNGDYEHQVRVLIEDSRFSGNSRRDIKTQSQGLSVHRCTFEKNEANTELPYGGLTTASVSIGLGDAVGEGDYHDDAEIIDCVFTNPHSSPSGFLGLSHARGAIVRGNRFEMLAPLPAGTGVSVSRKQSANIIEDNSFVNCGVVFGQQEASDEPTRIRGNRFQWTISPAAGGYFGAIFRNSSSSGATQSVVIEMNEVDVDVVQANGNFWGLYAANAGADTFDLVVRDNVVRFAGTSATQRFMYVSGDLGATNVVQDNVVTGINAAGAFRIDGAAGFMNINNTADGQPMTVD